MYEESELMKSIIATISKIPSSWGYVAIVILFPFYILPVMIAALNGDDVFKALDEYME